VLSVVAAKLGFAPVSALDVDEVALEVTGANAAANGVVVDLVARPVPSQLAVMNIALDVVESMLPQLPVGRAITSGYLERDEPRVEGWHGVERRVCEGWAVDLLDRS
jgi:ribosomal protein L11 methylase PrmA